MAALAPCEYKTGKALGQGSYATVKEAVKISTGEKFAVKVISKKLMRGREHMILNEIEVLKKVSKGHPNIVTLWDYFETPNNLYLVMDLCMGGELFDCICERGSFTEADAAEIVQVVVSAVAYLHDHNIIHRDIKPENLLFKTRNILSDLVIADFGLSKIVADDKFEGLITVCGTPGYMAPEVIQKKGHGKAVDLWSIGVLAYFLLSGYTPFDYGASSQADELDNILHGRFTYAPPYWSHVSDIAKDFISKLLIVDPHQRMTIHQALAHPWLRMYNASNDMHTPTPTTPDLMPLVRDRFNQSKALRRFRVAADTVIATNKFTKTPHTQQNNGFDIRDYRPTSEEDLMVIPRS
ncbi:putative calmodulin-dependent protein kinase type 1 [Fimicolochytrium jonesii]|uniref:putative calmodulin-dependent protein kinase type 1 n=1 Tax=Fimicolochytrium jonesii TaxID=1396493 RepID=UPI0022FF3FEE|nr:putative calmodulin-dependent protein kinase type 1 [Fimicolochytrium jonesii]KAI8823385.1 putative calmodulin-dependent protein kinase type 1 [Fimicolochytrium jonesii]